MMTNLFRLDVTATVVQHPYRTARVVPMFSIDRTTNEWREFEKKLAEKANKMTDNHVVYSIRNGNAEIHIQCSDMKAHVGAEIIILD